MAERRLTFRQRDVEAMIRAAKATGCEVLRVEVDKAGKIIIITARGAAEPASGEDEWGGASL